MSFPGSARNQYVQVLDELAANPRQSEGRAAEHRKLTQSDWDKVKREPSNIEAMNQVMRKSI